MNGERREETCTPLVFERVLDAALLYASLGWHVFPLTWNRHTIRLCPSCRPGRGCQRGEDCRCPVDTCHGFYAATTDADKIRRWWTRNPSWQIGIRTGSTSGLVVLDVDLDKGGLDGLISLQHAGLVVGGCAVMLSGSGQSFHLYYQHPGGYVPNSQSALGPGVDVRGDGGYVVGSPSRHPATDARNELLGPLTDLPIWPMPVGAQRPSGAGERRQKSLPWMRLEQGQPSCAAVTQALQEVADELEGGAHHTTILSPIMRLLRLRQQGHRGVVSALTEAEGAFVRAMAERRGEAAAQEEFAAVLNGAWGQMWQPREPRLHGACTCQVHELRVLLRRGAGLSRGSARNNEVKLMRHLLMRAEQGGCLLISESQRQVSEVIDVHQSKLPTILGRLEASGVLIRHPARGRRRGFLLNKPAAREVSSTREPTTAGLLDDDSSRAYGHPLFGAGGLGPALADTFAELDEYSLPVAHGTLLRVRKDSSPSPELMNPYRGTRQIPMPAGRGEGRTVAELAAVRRRSPSTIRLHLKRLANDGLVFQDGKNWFRARFAPSVLCSELLVVDTVACKRLEHERARRQYWEYRTLPVDGVASVVRVIEAGHATYVDCQTGEVRWVDPIAFQADQEAS